MGMKGWRTMSNVLREAVRAYVDENIIAVIDDLSEDLQVSKEFEEFIRALIRRCDHNG